MTTLKEWKERRPASDLKETVTFYHPSFGYYRTVNNLFYAAIFGGDSYQAARFSVTEPAQDGTATISMTITFVAGAENVRNTLKTWRGAQRMSAISCTYSVWDNIGDSAALNAYSLYVKDVSLDANNVTVTASLTNPLSLANPIIYTTKDYPGLLNL
ncbi:DUF1833 family protein [Tatumella sp. UCD-D_suzukii]|uniref:DUF1833 family protein n=1 Tax=Tatumella sp. UCD-D_suzukii TaxID=1408192 RepID=UPI00057140EE|nr:DUF1833 family protein [Tatumella sp. UCD-D_suzukii]